MKKTVRWGVAVATVASLLAVTPVALARSSAPASNKAVVTSGPCSATSTWVLTLKFDNGRVESDVEVQTSTAGQTWKFVMTDNGVKFGSGKRTTIADGSWTATRFATNQAGTDSIDVRSKNLTTGENCKADGAI